MTGNETIQKVVERFAALGEPRNQAEEIIFLCVKDRIQNAEKAHIDMRENEQNGQLWLYHFNRVHEECSAANSILFTVETYRQHGDTAL